MRSYDQEEGFEDKHEMSDSFVVDIQSLPCCAAVDVTAKSSIMRSLSRKGTQQQEAEKKNAVSYGGGDDGVPAPVGSPKAATLVGGGCAPDMSLLIQIPLVNHIVTAAETQQIQQQEVKNKAEGRWRRSGNQRAKYIDPWQILFLFATVSSMGTILLIYFTLTMSMGRLNGDASNSYS